MKTRLIFLLPLLWLLIGCEDSEPESKPDSTDPPLIEYHYELLPPPNPFLKQPYF